MDADGAYDTHAVYDALAACGATAVIPPRENAMLWAESHPRTMILISIVSLGTAVWQKESGYHRRSLVENAMYRFKPLVGDHLASHQFDTQVKKAHARVAAMNIMTALGRPVSVRIGVTAP